MKKLLMTTTAIATLLAIMPSAVNADGVQEVSNSLAKAFKNGKAYIDTRYRYETVDQDGFAEDADASTLRTKLGYTTGVFYDFTGVLEFENISQIGDNDYNDTVNGKVLFPTVADPDGTEINMAYLAYSGIDNTTLVWGRQRIILGDARFVGDVSWRQNDQMFDAYAVVNTSLPDTTIVYAYVYNINRINGNDHPLGDLNTAAHFLDVSYAGLPWGTLGLYAYLWDVDQAAALSSNNYGIRFDGKHALDDDWSFAYHLQYARQSDYADNLTSYDANYIRVVPALSYKKWTAKAGYELLGSDNAGTVSFQTPLATLHKFNGWADQFLATPAAGLQDVYGTLSYKVGGVGNYVDGTNLTLTYHDFSADEGSADYGSEWDFNITQTLFDHYTLGVKYANYNADTFSVDTEKLIFTFGIKFSQ